MVKLATKNFHQLKNDESVPSNVRHHNTEKKRVNSVMRLAPIIQVA
jgi:uncharacterized protein (UPF0147 family)